MQVETTAYQKLKAYQNLITFHNFLILFVLKNFTGQILPTSYPIQTTLPHSNYPPILT